MKHVPSAIAAMIILAAFLCLGLTTQLWACSDCICTTDNTCANDSCDVDLTANCTRLEFTAKCDGNYDLYASVTSCGTSCGKCYSCVNVFEISDNTEVWIANCHTNHCYINDCETPCNSSVDLSANVTYVLYVCKLFCPDYEGVEDCEDCDASCVAVGCLSYGFTSTSCTP